MHLSKTEGVRPRVPGLVGSILLHNTLNTNTWCYKGKGLILQYIASHTLQEIILSALMRPEGCD